MATSINRGNQIIFDKYHQSLQAAIVAEGKQGIIKPGVVSGLEVTKYNDTTVRIAAGIVSISDGAKTVTSHKQDIYDLAVDGVKQYVVMRYTYALEEEWYPDILNVSTTASNDVVLGKITYSGGLVQTVDLSVKTNAFLRYDEDIFVTALAKNKTLKALIEAGDLVPGSPGHIIMDSFWHKADSVSNCAEVMIKNVIPSLEFPKGSAKELYFRLKTGSVIDIKFKITFAMDLAASGLARFKLSYLPLSHGLDISSIIWNGSTEENLLCPVAADEIADVDTTTLMIPSSETSHEDRFILCKLERLISHANDTHTGSVRLIDMIAVI